MTTQPAAPLPHLPRRRSRLGLARDLLVAGLCALLVAGFLLDVARGVAAHRPAAAGAGSLSS
jgi:hypothetical protein